jgi:hypothetical protein
MQLCEPDHLPQRAQRNLKNEVALSLCGRSQLAWLGRVETRPHTSFLFTALPLLVRDGSGRL